MGVPRLALAFALAAISCTSGATTTTAPTSIATSGPTATLSATATPAPAPTTRVIPTTPPSGDGELEVQRQVVLAWKSGGSYVDYVVVAELKNVGSGLAELSAFDSDYTVLDSEGGITATGSFLYNYPRLVLPGELAYLVEEGLEDGARVADFDTVEVSAQYIPHPDFEVEIIVVEDIKWKRESQFSDGLVASGFITSVTDLDDVAVAVLCFDAAGDIIGASTTNLVKNVRADKRKAFETIQETGPLRPSDCKRSAGYVATSGF